ncbi:MAG TPA: Rv3235 family protein [Pseudonocardiaceae bacterium]
MPCGASGTTTRTAGTSPVRSTHRLPRLIRLADYTPRPATEGHRHPQEPPPAHTATPAATALDEQPPRPRRTGSPEQLGRALLTAILEVLAHRRPAQQLRHVLGPDGHRALAELRTQHPAGRPPRLRSLRVSSPREGAVEVCAALWCGSRLRALAGRIETRPDGRWHCTTLTVLTPNRT